MTFDLVLGTTNKKKLTEMQQMLPQDRVAMVTLADVANAIDVVEDGSTFSENAALKATQQAKHLGRWVLAEDSGLSVDALGGQPGIFSARYAGPEQDDNANLEKLLDAMKEVAEEKRGAHYTSAMCLSDPEGNVRVTSQGTCGGRLLTERCGTGGFGYDPIFMVREYHRTFGEMHAIVKQAISHRSRAIRRFAPAFLRLLSDY